MVRNQPYHLSSYNHCPHINHLLNYLPRPTPATSPLIIDPKYRHVRGYRVQPKKPSAHTRTEFPVSNIACKRTHRHACQWAHLYSPLNLLPSHPPVRQEYQWSHVTLIQPLTHSIPLVTTGKGKGSYQSRRHRTRRRRQVHHHCKYRCMVTPDYLLALLRCRLVLNMQARSPHTPAHEEKHSVNSGDQTPCPPPLLCSLLFCISG